jgi:signal transduction histidine kinase
MPSAAKWPLDDSGREAGADILVVDDSAANLVALQTALEGVGGTVVGAPSGEEALRTLLDRDFAVILLDVKMPTLGGFETARLIRERKRSRHTPIIFTTAYNRDDRDVVAAYRLGAVDFLFKPFAADVLRAKVAVFVELQRRSAELARQDRLLREHEHERRLEEERRRWKDEAMQRRLEELGEMDRQKDEFLAVLAHELRNPLAPLVSGLDLLQRKIAPGEAEVVQRTHQRMGRQLDNLRRLVDDLLDVSRVRTGRVELHKAPVAIQEVLETAVVAARPRVDERGHQLTVRVPPEPLLIQADGVRLAQVFTNLLNNAASFTQPGGAIDLHCELGVAALEITVRDNGPGIPSDLLPRVFDMFVQGRPGAGGLGLGLTVARRLVEMHGGTISVSSDADRPGTAFVVRLARASLVEAALPPAAAAATATPGRPLRVVVVDDNEDIRESTRDLLLELGHTVEVASDGEAGLEMILRLEPDVALVDVGMPVLDGYGVAARVRARLGRERTRLVAMTGFGLEKDRRRAIESGFDAHLVKPVDAGHLMTALENEEANESNGQAREDQPTRPEQPPAAGGPPLVPARRVRDPTPG